MANSKTNVALGDFSKLMGWLDRPKEVDKILGSLQRPVFGVAAAPLLDTGKGKTVLLYEAIRKTTGQDIILTQKRGVCVSKGWSLAIDGTKCVQIQTGARELFPFQKLGGKDVPALQASEIIYGGSRIEIGQGQCGTQDGSVGAWAAKYVQEYGTLVRGVYGKWDVSRENDTIAVAWGNPRAGVPDELEPQVREHPIKTCSLVQSYEEARDAIANGYFVTVCSNQGFTTTRDKDGFARPSGSWGHCMCFIAVDDAFKRPGLLCMNSWGPDWISGPRRLDQPEGSFWVDAATCTVMLSGRQMGGADSFALSGYTGYPKQKLSHLLI